MKKISRVLNIMTGCFIGIFAGHGFYVFFDYKNHPDLYAMQSAPWYTGILVYGIFTIVTVAVLQILKWIISKKR